MNPSVAKKFLETKEDSVAENATVTENLFIKASAHPLPTPETTNSKKSESRFFGVYELDPERYSRGEHDAGVASAMLNTSQQIGGSLGAALLNTVARLMSRISYSAGVMIPFLP